MTKNTLGQLEAEILVTDSLRMQKWWHISKDTMAVPVRALTRVDERLAHGHPQPGQQICKLGSPMVRLAALAVLLAASLSNADAQSTPSAPASATLPDGPGKSVAQRACVACHTLGVVTSKRASPDGWTQVVNEMVNRGADLSDDEIDTLIKYLSTNFGAASSKSGPSTTPGIVGQPASPDKAGQPASSNASTPPASVHMNTNKADTQ